MMMKLKINGETYPVRLTLGAMLRFKRETGLEVSEMGDQVSLMVTLMWCCTLSACRADGIPFDLSEEQFADSLTPDHLKAFSEAMAAEQAPDGDEAKKKEREKLPPPDSAY